MPVAGIGIRELLRMDGVCGVWGKLGVMGAFGDGGALEM